MKKHSEIFGWGNNTHGQLGISESSKTFERIPRSYTFQIQILSVSCGELHSLCLSSTGYVYSFGSNQEGRLGIGDKSLTHTSSPCLIKSLQKISKIACGASHSMALSGSGELYVWGLGRFGNLGTGSTLSQFSPVKINFPNSRACIQVSAGSKHSAAILTDGHKTNLFTCGEGSSGQLGTGKFNNELSFVKVFENILTVSCGYEHTAAISNEYELLVTGNNSEGQLGLGSSPCSQSFCKVNCEEVVKVACSNLTVCVTSAGNILVAGCYGNRFQSVDNKQVVTDVCAGNGYFLAADCNKRMLLWEAGKLKSDQKFADKTIEKFAAGKDFFLAIGKVLGDDRRARNFSMNFENKGMTCRNTARNAEDWKVSTADWSGIFETEKRETKNYVESLQKELETCRLELRNLKQQKESDEIKLEQEITRLDLENRDLRQGLKNAGKENQELMDKNLRLETEIKKVYSVKSDALYQLDKAQVENEELKSTVANLLKANNELSRKIEDDISSQVKSYREKTLDLLNTSLSPRIETKRTQQKTPQKENLKAKLAALQQNRARIQSNLNPVL